jgi:hypothetical protein
MAKHHIVFTLRGIKVGRVTLDSELVNIAATYRKHLRSVSEFAEDFLNLSAIPSWDCAQYHTTKA